MNENVLKWFKKFFGQEEEKRKNEFKELSKTIFDQVKKIKNNKDDRSE